MDRAHRLGQSRTVNVYRLLTRGTLEEKIMGLQRFKLDVAAAVVNQDNVSLSGMDTGRLLDLFAVQVGLYANTFCYAVYPCAQCLMWITHRIVQHPLPPDPGFWRTFAVLEMMHVPYAAQRTCTHAWCEVQSV